MRRKFIAPTLLCLALMPLALPASAQFAGVPQKLPFQGRLATPSGNPVPDAAYAVTFRIFNQQSGGTAVWSQTLSSVNARNGVFAVALDFASGYAEGQTLAAVFGGTPYLEIQVGADAPLTPRQPLFSVPYAFYSQFAAGVLPGSITQNSLASGLLNFSNLGGNLALGQIPDGLITATKLAPNVLNSLGWSLFGNSGTDASTNFIGTTDASPLILKANNARALRLEYAQSGTNTGINVIGGYNANSVDGSIVGATIAGGGGISGNVVTRNQIQANFGTIGGGTNNLVSSNYGTIPGGFGNQVNAVAGFAAGTFANAAHSGSFVWADGATLQNAPFTSTKINTFLIKAANGVGINKNNPATGVALDVNGTAVFSKVGIRTTTSAAELAVDGNALVTGNASIQTDLEVGGKALLRGIAAFGANVTPDPGTPITVQANSSNNLMLFTNSAGQNYRWRFNLNTDGNYESFSLFESGASNRITVRSGGNVGIGINTPTSLLHVAGTSDLAGNTTIGGDAAINGALNTAGLATLSGGMNVTGTSALSALTTSGNASVGGNLSVTGTSTLTGATRLRANSAVGANLLPDNTAPFGIQASPTNDLMVFANSSGANYRWRFKLNTDGASDAFTLFESGASNRLVVRPGGNVGIGTDTPNAKLAVNGTTQLGGNTAVDGTLTAASTSVFRGNTAFGAVIAPDANTPIAVQASNNNDLMVFTNSTGVNYRWRFKLNPDAGNDGFALYESGASNRLVVRPGGNVGIGTDAPSQKLQVAGNVLANNVSVPSDARFKHHIETLPNALETLLNLRGVTYEYNQDAFPTMNFNSGRQLGFIAQEVEKILPELVHTDSKGYKSVTYTNVIPVLVEAVKAQQKQIDALKANKKLAETNTERFQTLEAENRQLKALLLEMAQRLQRLETDARR